MCSCEFSRHFAKERHCQLAVATDAPGACAHSRRRFRFFCAFAVWVSDLETEASANSRTPPSTELKRTLSPSTQTIVARYTVPLVVTIENVADVFTSASQLYSCVTGVTGGVGGGGGYGDWVLEPDCLRSLSFMPFQSVW